MPPREPRFRATWTKLAIQAVNRLSDADRRAVRALVGDTMLAEIRACTLVDWLPIHAHLSVAAAVEKQLGTAGARSFWRERLLAGLETPLLRPLLAGALQIFGRTPYSLLRMTPRLYSMVSHDAGLIKVEQGNNGQAVSVAFDDFPLELCASPWYALCHGQCEAVLEYTRCAWTVDPQLQLGAGRFCYVVRKAGVEG